MPHKEIHVRFAMPKAEFDALMVQMSRRIHQLRNDIQMILLKAKTSDSGLDIAALTSNLRADLMVMEVLRERIQSGSYVKEDYVMEDDPDLHAE